jgi:hypothetical protein
VNRRARNIVETFVIDDSNQADFERMMRVGIPVSCGSHDGLVPADGFRVESGGRRTVPIDPLGEYMPRLPEEW